MAWVAAAFVPVAIPLGRAAGIAFLSARGYEVDEAEPPGLGLVSFLLLAAIVLVPVVAAVWFGVQAARDGHRSGMTAAVLAVLIGGSLVLLGLPLFLSRVVGWPVVVLVGAAVGGVVAAVAARRRRRPTTR